MDSYPLSNEQVEQYRRDGFIQLNDIVSGDDLTRLRHAVARAVEEESKAAAEPNRSKTPYEQIFIQKVNLWRRHETVKEFVLSRRFGEVAAKLMGGRARLWHDQALFKEPREGAKTPWHQDAVYWPHRQRQDQVSIWIALKDATIENGCMSFVPGTHALGPLERVDLANPRNIFDDAAEFKGVKPVICELKAGSCTFHNGLTFHYAGPNRSDEMREAFAILYMPDGTEYDGKKHIVTDPLKLKEGDKLDGEMFPLVS